MSVVFFLLSALLFTLSFARPEAPRGRKRDRPNRNTNKLRIVIEESCCDEYRSLRREIFENYQCLERSRTSNKDLKFRRDCIIYAKINEKSDRCYEDLREHECVNMIHFEPIYYTDSVDYSNDICVLQDVSQDDPCLLVYDTAFGADGTQCASTYLQDAVKPFYHLNYWYPNDPMDPYAYIYLDTTGVSNIDSIDVWILDSGIDRNHVEFAGLDIEKIGYEIGDPEIFSDHGTAVASNAIGNNIGIARGFAIKDCPVCQIGYSCAYEDLENCMMEVVNYYSSRPGRRFVINMSFGGPVEGDYVENFDDMVEAGGILVAAAGNDRSDNDLFPHYPSNNPLVISVSGYNQDRNMYSAIGGSNYGTNTVDYYAAAQNNLVALASDSTPDNSNELYTYFEGTSFASPIVAGEVANILARDLSLTVDDIRAELDSRVIGNVLDCPVESCPMIEGYCNTEGATRNPTTETISPTLEPTQNPTQTTTNPTMAPTILNSCLTNICQYVDIFIDDYSNLSSTIILNTNDIFQVSPEFKSMKVSTEGTHTWQEDLVMTLISPDNTEIILVDTVGGSNDNFSITFSDEADSFPINLNVNGDEYKPEESFSNFGLQSPIGSWTFTLYDQFGGDQGIWESWCITEICFYHIEGTLNPTATTNTPTMIPTSNPTITTTNPTLNPTSSTSTPTTRPTTPTNNPTFTRNPTSNPVTSTCITNICKNANIIINDNTIYSSSININETDFDAVTPIFLSMKVSTEGTHTYQGDLRMTLTSPDNTQILLVDNRGGSIDNFNITFSDDALSFPTNLNVNGDEYKPAQELSSFYSEYIFGIWTFVLADEAGGDQGIWQSWCITELCFYEERTESPSEEPTENPTIETPNPTQNPTEETSNPTLTPTQHPTIETLNPTLEPTQNPTQTTTNPTMAPTILNSCIYDICQNVDSVIYDFSISTSSIDIDTRDIDRVSPEFKSMKVRAEGTHTFQADLIMNLTSPDGTEILLVGTVGSNNDNFNITFSDEADFFPINLNVNGDEYKPAESFSNFGLQSPLGRWTFSLQDQFGGDEGIWESWCITELCFYHLEGTLNPTATTNAPNSSPTSNPIPNTCVTDICKNANIPINDNLLHNSNININESDIDAVLPRIVSMKVSAEGTHTWQSDLRMTLTSPNNTQILLVDDVGGDDDHFNITFSDDALFLPINLNVNGDEYKPEEELSTFYFENLFGTWTFGLEDDAGGDQGVWESWCITEVCFYDEGTEFPTSNPTSNPITEEPEPEPRCCRATPEGRLINYQCRDFNRRRCINDELCRYRENIDGC